MPSADPITAPGRPRRSAVRPTKHWAKLIRGLPKPRRGRMNGLEAAYAEHLAALEMHSHILWWRFEGFSLRLADGAHYTPDFAVMLPDGTIELHETKGQWREAARIRIKVAAETFPFRFVGVRSVKGQWIFEDFSSGSSNSDDKSVAADPPS